MSETIKATPADTIGVFNDRGVSETVKGTPADTIGVSHDCSMSETVKVTSADTTAIDVFTHSKTGFPGAWPEDDVDLLLDAWHDVIEDVRAPKKRSDAAFKVLKRLRRKGLREVDKEAVRRQMINLNTEYKTHLGLEKSGIPTVKAKCLSKLEKILGPPASHLQREIITDNASEESDHSMKQASTAGESPTEDIKAPPNDKEPNPDTTATLDEEGGNRKRRFKGRMNIRRLAQLQQLILSEIQTLQKAKADADEKYLQLLTTIVDLHKNAVENQQVMIESLKALKL